MKYLLLTFTLFITLSGCSMNKAKSLNEFRQAEEASSEETYNSPLAYEKVTNILIDRFKECLSMQIKISDDASNRTKNLNPTIKFDKSSGVAYLQIDTRDDYTGSSTKTILSWKYIPPRMGRYAVLADVKKIDSGTQLHVVHMNDSTPDSEMADITARIIKTWSQGENLNACPNY